MRAIVKTSLVLTLILLAAGLLVTAVGRVRDAARQMQCLQNLKAIGVGLHSYHDTNHHFPTGTLPNAGLPPERRLSWRVQVYPPFMEGGVQVVLDQARPWDAPENWPPRILGREYTASHEERWHELTPGPPQVFSCPANPLPLGPGVPIPTAYLGVAGVGEAAAELPLADPRAGFFGYDRQLTREDIKDGLSTTAAVVEGLDGGPWTAGGGATVRGLVRGGRPHLGVGGQFASGHRGGTNVLFADGSARLLSPSVSPAVFEALVTVAGGEKVSPPED
jgi:prepilin-type processing-associated H-X9-DG protein